MGKIRVKVLGDEEAEKKQQEEAKKRAETKRAEKSADSSDDMQAKSDEPKEAKKKVVVKKDTKGNVRSAKYTEKAGKVDHNKIYSLSEAVALLPTVTISTFDETVELHINTTDKGVSGQMTLPHGTGKQTKVAIINPSDDSRSADELIKAIEGGTIDFDVLIATPDAMPKLARVARVLGPRGLMPNPKNGTVTPKPEDAAAKFAGGQMNYKTEAKFPILHLVVGKVSFGDEKIQENIKVAIKTVSLKNIKNVTLKSTMSPGIRLDVSSL